MDERGNRETSHIYWGLELIDMVILISSLFLDAKGILPDVPWQNIAIGAALIFAILTWRRIYLLERTMWSRTPNVKMKETSVTAGGMWSKKPIIISAKEERTKSRPTDYAHAIFINEPKRGTEQNHANNVRAILTYYDENGRRICGPIDGRWAGSAPPKSPEDIEKIIRKRIRSDGSNETLDVASKPVDDGAWYAYNNQNHFFLDMIDESFRLRSNTVDVHIELRGERVQKGFWLRMYNEGKEGRIRIEERKSWIKRAISRKQKKDIPSPEKAF